MRKQFTTSLVLLTFISLLIFGAAAHGLQTHQQTQQNQRTTQTAQQVLEEPCPNRNPGWRNQQTIAGVQVQESKRCNPDNPNVVAASVKGTNNVPMSVLMKSGLNRNAVVKGNDTDGDGDPDNIHITLEVSGINEENPIVTQEIAPGINPAFWTFSPKTRGMTDNNSKVQNLMKVPSPTIRVEEGDNVTLEIENTHYMPHTVHLHGVDHPYSGGNHSEGGDGVPITNEMPIKPGESREYSFQPGTPGTMFYHCHVIPNTHVSMGLNGMFVIEEEKDNNTVQTLNPQAGKVRHPSQGVSENYTAEYDMVYQDLDKELHELPKDLSDTREIAKAVNRDYDITDASSDYFMLNGLSYPYTLRESNINVEPNERYKMRVLNAAGDVLSLHTHGHKFKVQQKDGVSLKNEIQRDVIDISAAQRVDLSLNTTIDGLNSYGEGLWIMHDHSEEAVTTDGISPGGNVAMIAYDSYLKDNGMPDSAVNTSKYFSEQYYEGNVPFFEGLDQQAFGYPPSEEPPEVPTATREQSSSAMQMDDSMNMEDGSMSGMNGMSGMGMMDMEMVPAGTVINGNKDELPPGCEEVKSVRDITIKAGEKFAEPGEAFAYNSESWEFNTCEKVNIEFVNLDETRHQWMIHGLPKEVYPMGMFNLEAMNSGTIEGTFITPSEPRDLLLHCSLPQHEQKGMQATVSITDRGSGGFFSFLSNIF